MDRVKRKLTQDRLMKFKFLKIWTRVRVKLNAYIMFLRILVKIREKNCGNQKDDEGKPRDMSIVVLEKMPCMMVHPESRLKLLWNIIIAVLLLYTAVIMPYSLTFIESSDMDKWGIIDIFLDIAFFIDVIVNCCSAIYDSTGVLITSRKTILWKYFTSWMLLDLTACFPFGLINNDTSGPSSNSYNSLLKLLRLPRLYRLFRITRLFKLFKHFKNSEIGELIQEFLSIKHSLMKLIKSSVTILLCVHIFSCFWYYIAKIEGIHPDSWIISVNIQDEDNFFLYITSVYWAVSTLTSVGYGDIHPSTNLEKLFSIGWMAFSMYFLSFVIGSLSTMLSKIDSKENVLVTKLAVIDEFAKEAKIEKNLISKLKYALRYSTEKTGFSWGEKQNLFNELPKKLRYEVSLAMHKGAAKNLFFFTDKDHIVISSIVPFLQPGYIRIHEYVYEKGDYAEEIYFNVKGTIVYRYGKKNLPMLSVQKGDYFGDIEVCLEILRKCPAQANRNTEILIMSKKVICNIIEEYPRVWEEIKNKACGTDKKNAKFIAEIQTIKEFKKKKMFQEFDLVAFNRTVQRKIRNNVSRIAYQKKGAEEDDEFDNIDELHEKLDAVCSIFEGLDREMTEALALVKARHKKNLF